MALYRDVRPGDSVEISGGPCVIRLKRKRGKLRMIFNAQRNVRVLHVQNYKTRIDKRSRKKLQ